MLSFTSVSTWAAKPSRYPIVQRPVVLPDPEPTVTIDAEEERVGDAHARPAPVPLVRLRRAVVVAADRDAVHPELRQEVRGEVAEPDAPKLTLPRIFFGR